MNKFSGREGESDGLACPDFNAEIEEAPGHYFAKFFNGVFKSHCLPRWGRGVDTTARAESV